MKTISIRLENSVYDELDSMLEAMGQTKQTFYETFTKTALRERCIPFMIKAPASATNAVNRLEAFEKLEASRKKNAGLIDYDAELEGALSEKYGNID